MRIICLDLGTKRIGLAVSDPLGFTAQPVDVLLRQDSFEKDFVLLSPYIDKYKPSKILIGLPISLSGDVNSAAQKALAFTTFLKGKTDIPVETWDERFTTKQASNLHSVGMNAKEMRGVIDKYAAAVILESYLGRISPLPPGEGQG